MTTLKQLEEIPEEEFQAFFKRLPARVQLLVRGNMVDWRTVLLPYFIREKRIEKYALENTPSGGATNTSPSAGMYKTPSN